MRVVGYSPLGVGALLTEPRVVSFAEDLGLPPAPALVDGRSPPPRRRQIVGESAPRKTFESIARWTKRTKRQKVGSNPPSTRSNARSSAIRMKFCWDPAAVSCGLG